MVDPDDIPRIVTDAARLVRQGVIVLFGSSALAYWLDDPPRTRDVDLWCEPPEQGEIVEALMGELSWYDEKHGAYVEVWAQETFAAPLGWRERARVLTFDELPDVSVIVPHPHDVLLAKLGRFDESDRDHADRVLAQYPLDEQQLGQLAASSPYRTGGIVEPDRRARFEFALKQLSAMVRRRS